MSKFNWYLKENFLKNHEKLIEFAEKKNDTMICFIYFYDKVQLIIKISW
jgi:hypothetical protein